MSKGCKPLLATVVLATAIGAAGEASAARLFKGVAVVLERTNTAACAAEYDISESFIVEYLANTGAETTPERLSIVGANGSLLLTNADSTPKLNGAGSVSITGNILAKPVSIPSVTTHFTVSGIVATSLVATMSAVVMQLGIPGCSVKIRAALTYLPPGGY